MAGLGVLLASEPRVSAGSAQAIAIRVAVVSQQSAPKIQAISGNHAGHRQASTKATIVSVPSVRPPR